MNCFVINRKGVLDQFEADAHPVEADARNAVYQALGNNLFAQGLIGIKVDSGTKTATAVAGAATLNKASGQITTESLTTAAAADYTLTVTDSAIAATDLVMASFQLGTNTTGTPVIRSVTPAAGSLVIKVYNAHASAAFNGTLVISFVQFIQ